MGSASVRPPPLSEIVLEVRDLRRDFGAVSAVDGVTLAVARGERRAIIGPNGAGKTTLFNLISGEMPPTAGMIVFEGVDVTALPPEARVTRGIGRTFQRSNLFPSLTSLESVTLAVQQRLGVSRWWRRRRVVEARLAEESRTILANVGLDNVGDEPVRNLSYGFQRQLEVALALATAPRVLLLDEPTAGLSPAETGAMRTLITSLDRSLTIVIIEHDMDVVFALADRITVLHNGRLFADGTPEEIREHRGVRDIYFGLDEPAH
jgi:branched-chain amino acid transport system ATP-binding protein